MTDGFTKHSTSPDDDIPSQRSLNVINRTTIREANSHLQLLHSRNQELEQLVHDQHDQLQRKDQELTQLSQSHQLLERHCQQLQALLDDRTRRLYAFERKEVLFRETLELKPAIESLLEVLNTFEKADHTPPTIPINTKPLQFVQASSQKKDNDRTDAV